MTNIRIGVQLHPQHASYVQFAAAVKAVEGLGVDTIWNWDHFFPLYGEKDGLHFEGWTLLTAMATLTQRAEVGCMVTCNSYRNPQLLADMARTIDHISNGRLILGIGAGWFERDYQEYGYEFGSAADRIRAFSGAMPLIESRLGKLNPPPVRKIPVLIGAAGEKVMLRLVARHADIWNMVGAPEEFRQKNAVLDEWCAKERRDPLQIERSVVVQDEHFTQLDDYLAAGATHLILGLNGPYPLEKVEALVRWREGK